MTRPERRRPAAREIVTATGNLAWTLLLLVGSPLALAHFFGWPLPTAIPDWQAVTSTPIQLVDPVVILNVFVCLAWLCWAVIALYIALDIVDAVRGIGRRLHRIGPLGTVATKFVGSAALLISLARPTAGYAEPPPPAPNVLVVESLAAASAPAQVSPDAVASPSPAPSAATANPSYTVQRGDSLWAIAETHLGSGFRWREIHDLNRHLIRNPDLICVGWQLTLPVDAAAITATPNVEPAPAIPATVEPPTEPMPDPPPPPTPPADANQELPPLPQPEPRETPPPATATESPTATGSVAASQPEVADERDPADTDTALLPSLVGFVPGITGATVLASGYLLLLRGSRRGRRSRSAHTSELERSLVAAADVPLVRWAGQELAALGEQLARRRATTEANPLAVEFSEDTGLEVLWDRPFRDAPTPWEAVPGAWAWRLLYDPDEPVPNPERPALIAGLVTFGCRDGRQLQIDLESLGSLSIDGDPSAVEAFVRALVVELSAADEIADCYVALDPELLDVPSSDDLPRLDLMDPSEACQRILDASSWNQETLASVDCSSTFTYRLYDAPVLPLEVHVAVTRADAPRIDDLLQAAEQRHGVTALIVGHHPAAKAHLHIDANGSARLEPLGLSFDAAALPLATDAGIAELFDGEPSDATEDSTDTEILQQLIDRLRARAAEAPTPDEDVCSDEMIDLRDEPVVHTQIEPTLGLEAEPDDWEPSEPRMLVRVLGQPELVNGPPVRRRELIVIVCMACLGRPARREDIQEAVWRGQAVEAKTIWNLITRARAQLGQWDGKPILSKPSRPENTIELANGVMTDLELLRALVDRSTRVPSSEAMRHLRDGLALVTGPPFDADGYDWARIQQHAHEAETLIEAAALGLVELALESGDHDIARFALMQGLRGLPGNEALYRARMRIENAAGNASAVRAAYRELSDHLEDFGWSPSEETERTLAVLTSAPLLQEEATRHA